MPSDKPNPNAAAAVEECHAAYCQGSGLTLRLDPWRMRQWAEYVAAGWTAADMSILLRYLRREIAATKRNTGALKLSNLLARDGDAQTGECVWRLEEDLALAKKEFGLDRPAAPAPPPEPTGWRAWVRDAYPRAEIPREFSALPVNVQRECRQASQEERP